LPGTASSYVKLGVAAGLVGDVSGLAQPARIAIVARDTRTGFFIVALPPLKELLSATIGTPIMYGHPRYRTRVIA